MQHRNPIWICSSYLAQLVSICELHSFGPVAGASVISKIYKNRGNPKHHKHLCCTFRTGGNAVQFFKNEFWRCRFVMCKGWGASPPSSPPPPPSPPPFLAKLRTAQGLVRNLARKGGGEGGKFQRGHRTLLAPLCHHLCPFFFYCFCMLSCYFFTCPIYNILLHLLSHHIMHLKP